MSAPIILPFGQPADLFWYRFTFERAIDGDTIEGLLDLGFRVSWRVRLRLYGIDTPEMNDPDAVLRQKAMEARDYVIQALGNKSTTVLVRTYKDQGDKYGRWLGVVWYTEPFTTGFTWKDLNLELVTKGLAHKWPV